MRITGGNIGLARDIDDGGTYQLTGHNFDLQGWGPQWIAATCTGNCGFGSVVDVTRRLTFVRNESNGTVNGRFYPQLELEGELTLLASPAVIPVDVTRAPEQWEFLDTRLQASGRVVVYETNGELFEMRLSGGGSVRVTLRGDEEDHFWISEAMFYFTSDQF